MQNKLDQIAQLAAGLSERFEDGNIVDEKAIDDTKDGISLLTLKNQALLSYINNLVLIIAGQVERAAGDEEAEKIIDDATKRTIEQRVTMEKGIKGLESKIQYQVDKVLRTYRKSQEAVAAQKAEPEQANGDDDSDSDSDDATSYRPNVNQLRSANQDDDSEEETAKPRKYTVPKISATAPTTKDRSSRRRDFTMEEYLQDTADAPVAEPSIGTTIMDHGRGGMSTDKDRRKQKEVDDYEEENLTRIQTVSSKQARRDARQRQRDAHSKSFFGEDWGFLESNDKGRKTKKRRKN